MSKLESNLVGVAGEYLVAGELSRRGHIASITLRNSRGIDIIASSADSERTVSIQVKASSSNSKAWILTKKSETFKSDKHFYIFVDLKEPTERPDFFIVPSTVVADTITKDHANWLSHKKRNGDARKDSNMRKFADKDGKYLEKWEFLGL